MFTKPSRYFIEYSNYLLWEALHRTPGEPADPEEYRRIIDVRTLRAARKEAASLLEQWEFAQPQIRRRTHIVAVSWDYSSVAVSEEVEEG